MSATNDQTLVRIGAYLMLIGQAIDAASVVVLSDGSVGSPRSLGVAVGSVLSALGAYLIMRGHGSVTPTPPIQSSDAVTITIPTSAMNAVLKTVFGAVSPAQANKPATQPS